MEGFEIELTEVLRKYRDRLAGNTGSDPVAASYDVARQACTIALDWAGYVQLAAGEP
jgi:hypothetical protein